MMGPARCQPDRESPLRKVVRREVIGRKTHDVLECGHTRPLDGKPSDNNNTMVRQRRCKECARIIIRKDIRPGDIQYMTIGDVIKATGSTHWIVRHIIDQEYKKTIKVGHVRAIPACDFPRLEKLIKGYVRVYDRDE